MEGIWRWLVGMLRGVGRVPPHVVAYLLMAGVLLAGQFGEAVAVEFCELWWNNPAPLFSPFTWAPGAASSR